MHTPALLMMGVANLVVITFTLYYFWRVLKGSPPPDAVDEDDANYPRGG